MRPLPTTFGPTCATQGVRIAPQLVAALKTLVYYGAADIRTSIKVRQKHHKRKP